VKGAVQIELGSVPVVYMHRCGPHGNEQTGSGGL